MNYAVDAAAVAAVISLVSSAKVLGLPGKYAPIAAIVLGMVYSVSLKQQGLLQDLFSGLAVGLAAAGTYSSAKAITKSEFPSDVSNDIIPPQP